MMQCHQHTEDFLSNSKVCEPYYHVFLPPCFTQKTSAQLSPLHLADALTLLLPKLHPTPPQQKQMWFVMSGEWKTNLDKSLLKI